MPLISCPGPPFDVLSNHVEKRQGRLCLIVGLLLSLQASASSRASVLAFQIGPSSFSIPHWRNGRLERARRAYQCRRTKRDPYEKSGLTIVAEGKACNVT